MSCICTSDLLVDAPWVRLSFPPVRHVRAVRIHRPPGSADPSYGLLQSAGPLPQLSLGSTLGEKFASGCCLLVEGVPATVAEAFESEPEELVSIVAKIQWDFPVLLQMPETSVACRAFLASDHLMYHDQRQHLSKIIRQPPPGYVREPCPTGTANRVLGGHVPSSPTLFGGMLSICSGDRLRLIPRGSALGALMAEDVGSTDTGRASASVSSSAVIRGCRGTVVWIMSSALANSLAARRQCTGRTLLQRFDQKWIEPYQVYSTPLD